MNATKKGFEAVMKGYAQVGGWYRCFVCSGNFRFRSEMELHMREHERESN